MLYSSFAFLVNEYWPFVFLVIVWCSVFFSRIFLKEESLRKKEGYDKYGKNSYLLLFKIFSSDVMNYLFYTGLVLASIYCYYNLEFVGEKILSLRPAWLPNKF